MENQTFQIISIEGNIGSGKSTLLSMLKAKFGDNKNIVFLQEPVDDWETITDINGVTMLEKFYANQKEYSFPFQMMAYISRLALLKKAIREHPGAIIITERSLYTDKHVFAKMLHDQGKIEDVCYQIYLNWFDEFAKDFPINYTVYVQTDPTNCYHRIHKRAREGEEVIPLAYLQDCHNYHEDFLDEQTGISSRKLNLDGNVDIYKNEQIVEDWLSQIKGFISN